MKKPQILIIDDNADFVDDLTLLLKQKYDCISSFSGEDGIELIEQKRFDAILLDIDLGKGMDGFDFLENINRKGIDIPVIMITGDTTIDTIVRSIKMGAYDYFCKKQHLYEIEIKLNRALNDFLRRRENKFWQEEIHRFTGELLGESSAILNIKEKISKLSCTDSTVLITGESGTGKELIARQIYRQSYRNNKPFVVINCAAIPRELFESELFGYEKGAFTGAFRRKTGKFELANKGTIFFDEIGELDNYAQAKLLRVLEDKSFERVGGELSISVDVRILTATNKNLKELTQSGEFRNDLYFRLAVTTIHLPPLRERRDDIPILVNEFIRRKSLELKKEVKGISQDALDMLIAYDWPGNVRELLNVIENALIFSDTQILDKNLFPSLLISFGNLPDYKTAKKRAMEKFQREYISSMLRQTGGNLSQAAKRMGITRQGLKKVINTLKLNL